jgi:hypothetical protein
LAKYFFLLSDLSCGIIELTEIHFMGVDYMPSQKNEGNFSYADYLAWPEERWEIMDGISLYAGVAVARSPGDICGSSHSVLSIPVG